jgi:hypothetical protein
MPARHRKDRLGPVDRQSLTFFGVKVDLLSEGEVVGIAEEAMKSRARVRHTALNVDKPLNL